MRKQCFSFASIVLVYLHVGMFCMADIEYGVRWVTGLWVYKACCFQGRARWFLATVKATTTWERASCEQEPGKKDERAASETHRHQATDRHTSANQRALRVARDDGPITALGERYVIRVTLKTTATTRRQFGSHQEIGTVLVRLLKNKQDKTCLFFRGKTRRRLVIYRAQSETLIGYLSSGARFGKMASKTFIA